MFVGGRSVASMFTDFNFGEYDGRQEYLREESYFLDSFILPPNFNLASVSGRKKFLIIGHKGVGKSSIQLFIENSKRKEGYLTDFLSFYDDLSPSDYLEFSKTQKISFVEIANSRDVTALYDFREVWTRIILKKISDMISIADRPAASRFVKLMRRTHSGTRSLVDSIISGLKIKADFGTIFGEIGVEYDFSKRASSGELGLADFNQIALSLLSEEHSAERIYFSIDELVVSNFESKSDEFRVRMALIRDVLKVSNSLNNYFASRKIDINIICSLRPEVRDYLYNIDADLSKFIDSCYISMDWDAVENINHPLIEVLYKKIQIGSPVPLYIGDVPSLFSEDIDFTRPPMPIQIFMLRQSWHRPRDVVRFLKCYAGKNSRATNFTRSGVSSMLDDYSRISARECFDEISVKYSSEITAKIRELIRKKKYDSYDEFISCFSVLDNRLDVLELGQDLFRAGVVYNVDKNDDGRQSYYFQSHRGGDTLFKDMAICVHHGLWNYFGIRQRKY